MSIRTALTGVILLAVATTSGLVAILGVAEIRSDAARSAQERVNRSLNTFDALFVMQQERLAERLQEATRGLSLADPGLQGELGQRARRLELNVFNVCGADGRPIAGSYGDRERAVPVGDDPVLRRALAGETNAGVVLLAAGRLDLEGGVALCNAVAIPAASRADSAHAGEALFLWAAVPLPGPQGTIGGVAYGGRALNLNHAIVDELRDLVFGTASYAGKPLGTTTVFLRDMRIATNVLQPDRRRAVGTVVSAEVRRSVLELGQRWNDRALVVDAWYQSAYKPLLDPDGTPVGMLYAGLLEAPYVDASRRFSFKLVGIIAAGAVLATLLGAWLVGRITNPLRQLSEATRRLAAGQLDDRVDDAASYAEVRRLTVNFRQMQAEIQQRERALREKNDELAQANSQLERANKNYMSTLGFVTHELKSPLAAMQGLIDVLLGGLVAGVPEKARSVLVRIKRNCEELQDMVKNYLDLARAERGELVATMTEVEVRQAVLEPAIEQAKPLFESRQIALEVAAPERIPATADGELLRIALANLLSNAAKYGREGGRARLAVTREGGEVRVAVWNEGAGFTREEGAKLFRKFTRLSNATTTGKRGSGLGLFLCQQILTLHGGRVWADSAPGEWAEFGFAFPDTRAA